MKTKAFLLSLLLAVCCCVGHAQNYTFPYYRNVIPVFFHGSANLSVQACYDMVDEVNNNFIASSVGFSVYVAEVDPSSPACPSASAPSTSTNSRPYGLNVYIGLCASSSGASDVGSDYYSPSGYISLSTYNGSVLTHEIGHALGLPHPSGSCVNPNWNDPRNSNDPLRLANCYDGSADCIAGTDPNVNNWMNPGTFAPSVFTYCQHARMVEFMKSRVALSSALDRQRWLNLPTSDNGSYVHGGLSTVASTYETPVPVLDLNYMNPYYCSASLKFIRPAGHTTHTQANYVTVSYATRCPNGSLPTGYSFSTTLTTSLAETLFIPKNYGIVYLDYTFKTSATATTGWTIRQYVDYNYTAPPAGSSYYGASCAGCSVPNGGGGGTSKAAPSPWDENTRKNSLETYVRGDQIVCSNTGFTGYLAYNMLGQKMAEGSLVNGENTVSLANLPAGAYVVSFYDATGNRKTVLFTK